MTHDSCSPAPSVSVKSHLHCQHQIVTTSYSHPQRILHRLAWLTVLLLLLHPSSVIPVAYAKTTVPNLSWVSFSTNGSSPAPRSDFTMTYDWRRRLAYVYGGRASDGTILEDTWVLDVYNRRWRRPLGAASLTDPHPPARYAAVGGMDQPISQERDAMIVATGLGTTPDGQMLLYNDVWSFDLNFEIWTKLNATGKLPSPRYGAAGGIDASNRRNTNTTQFLIVSHGRGFRGTLNDAWILSLGGSTSGTNYAGLSASWKQISVTTRIVPPPRSSLASAVLPQHRLFIQGGCGDDPWALQIPGIAGTCPANEAYVMSVDPETVRGQWQLLTSSDCPGPQLDGAMARNPDSFSDSVILVGGDPGALFPQQPAGQFSIYDSASDGWGVAVGSLYPGTERYPSPRRGAGLVATDPTTNQNQADLIMFGGHCFDGSGASNEVWLLRPFSPASNLPGTSNVNSTNPDITPVACPMTPNLVVVHGVLMLLAFGIFIPLGAAFARYLPRGARYRIYVHGTLQSLGVTLGLVGLCLAILMIGPARHAAVPHAWFGLLVLAGAVFLPCYAFFRPEVSPPTFKGSKKPLSSSKAYRHYVDQPPPGVRFTNQRRRHHAQDTVVMPGFRAPGAHAYLDEVSTDQPASCQRPTPRHQVPAPLHHREGISHLHKARHQNTPLQSNEPYSLYASSGSVAALINHRPLPMEDCCQTVMNAQTEEEEFDVDEHTQKQWKALARWTSVHIVVGSCTVILGLGNVALGIALIPDASQQFLGPYLGYLSLLLMLFFTAEWFRHRGNPDSSVYSLYTRRAEYRVYLQNRWSDTCQIIAAFRRGGWKEALNVRKAIIQSTKLQSEEDLQLRPLNGSTGAVLCKDPEIAPLRNDSPSKVKLALTGDEEIPWGDMSLGYHAPSQSIITSSEASPIMNPGLCYPLGFSNDRNIHDVLALSRQAEVNTMGRPSVSNSGTGSSPASNVMPRLSHRHSDPELSDRFKEVGASMSTLMRKRYGQGPVVLNVNPSSSSVALVSPTIVVANPSQPPSELRPSLIAPPLVQEPSKLVSSSSIGPSELNGVTNVECLSVNRVSTEPNVIFAGTSNPNSILATRPSSSSSECSRGNSDLTPSSSMATDRSYNGVMDPKGKARVSGNSNSYITSQNTKLPPRIPVMVSNVSPTRSIRSSKLLSQPPRTTSSPTRPVSLFTNTNTNNNSANYKHHPPVISLPAHAPHQHDDDDEGLGSDIGSEDEA
ncbi:hypothetical protein SeMB42_g02985 [Synchytrium endobioticum]|uniref:Cytochrome b561 domain-containing protein n=1 Tax=Synchytrium endobioticum TaxID=286115 RepID=A0A507DAH9_9FUNG|nr:hypothetical protein SeMB42_g02985 [Synchytrium endobioticum]TPX49017.1 hypothetical protein SeLEV6574_g01706 [Synchytrium endobioticum]